MSCSKCGTLVLKKSFTLLFVLASLAFVSFGISFLILPFESFFVFSIILLFGLRYLEKEFQSIDRKESRCSVCGHVVNLAHTH